MFRVNSPNNSDQGIEMAIQAAGADKAPRVVPTALREAIKSVHYFTAGEGLMASIQTTGTTPGWPTDDISTLIPKELDLLTFCVIVLRNGFTVVGKSSVASPENFRADIGKRIAYENAEREIWPLLGYALKEQLSKEQAR